MKFLFLFFSLLVTHSVSGQAFEKFKLSAADIPGKYKISERMFCKAIQPKIFYDNPDLYESLLGNVKRKDYQSFESRDDKGTVLFFEYEKNIEHKSFLEGLLWGGNRPSKDHPEEFLILGNILIIWSFDKKSEIKKLSAEKVRSVS